MPDDALTIVDRGFFSAGVLIPRARKGDNRHWLTRARKDLSSRELKRFARHDALVEMNVSSSARAKNSTLPQGWVARAITYQRKGFRPQLLLTSLLDSEKYPAREIIALYHERWELECLVEAGGRVLTRDQIQAKVWGPAHHGTPRTIDNFILQLRTKLEDNPTTPRHILTVRGIGYRFT